jgi:acetaldehyde dehydrogenase/alcohol dehydrogenase
VTAGVPPQPGIVARPIARGRATVSGQEPPIGISSRLARASDAQRSFTGWAEPEVDELLEQLTKGIVDRAKDLAERTVAETGMGRAADKELKNRFAAQDVLRSVRGQIGCGVLSHDDYQGVTEIARPVGVVLGLMPVTNPVATLAFTTLIALKSRDALVVRAHPLARRVTADTVALLHEILVGCGAPAGLLQAIAPVDRAQLGQLFSEPAVDLILATGSTGLVKAAAASGKPTIGAGGGNAPVWICADADIRAATGSIVLSKSFDHGVICGSEQHLLVDAVIAGAAVTELRRAGATVLSRTETAKLAATFFQDGRPRRDLVGHSAADIAARAGIDVDADVRLLVAPVEDSAEVSPWGLERLAPVVELRVVSHDDGAFELCRALLRRGGAGHTAAIHTTSDARVLAFAQRVPVSRVIVNGPSSHGCIGMGNGLTPSLTLACGPSGGATTTDNITYRNLMQVTRVARSWSTSRIPGHIRSVDHAAASAAV